MERMFYQAYAFDADITRWDTSMVTYLFQMFYSATAWKSRFHNCGSDSSSRRRAARLHPTRHRAALTTVHPPRGSAKTTRATRHATDNGRRQLHRHPRGGTSCVPTCNPGYVLSATSCTNRVLTEALCVWPIADGAELKAAVATCLDAVPPGRSCSSDPRCWYNETAMRRCGALGCSDMPDWDVSQVMDAQNLFAGRSSFYQDLAGWTFPDDAIRPGCSRTPTPGSPLNRARMGSIPRTVHLALGPSSRAWRTSA